VGEKHGAFPPAQRPLQGRRGGGRRSAKPPRGETGRAWQVSRAPCPASLPEAWRP